MCGQSTFGFKMWHHEAVIVLLALALYPANTKLDIKKLSKASGPNTNIFADLAFNCPGEVTGWEFYASKKGTFIAAVWRPQPQGQFELIGRSKVTAERKGKQVVYLPKSQRFRAVNGDVIGTHYETEGDQGVIMYARNGDKTVPESQLSRFASVRMFDKDMPDNFLMSQTLVPSKKKMPSVRPILSNERIRLDGGAKGEEGRAMFYNNGRWGSVCDQNYVGASWPDAFCRELGYSHAEKTMLASLSYVGTDQGPVSLQGPTCSPKANFFVDDCNKKGETCSYNHDIFIRCARDVKLEAGVAPFEGRAAVYKDGRWGTVCDDKHAKSGWASTLCHDMGYDHAVKVAKASETYVGQGQGKVNLMKPECSTPKWSSQLVLCTNGHGSCSHDDDTFIKCENGVKLYGGKTSDEGIAMVTHHGRWGTVCDNDPRRDDWPTLFCELLGFDKVVEIAYANKKYTGIGGGFIAQKNPRCNAKDAVSMANCGHDFTTDCDHDRDVFIKCGLRDMCMPNPCQNGANCMSMRNNYRCECLPGFRGPHCEIDIDECESNPCQHGGTCMDLVNGYRCACATHYTGRNCQLSALPTDPVLIRSYDKPNMGLYAATNNSYQTVDFQKKTSAFKIVPGLIGATQTAVSFMSSDGQGYVVRAFNNQLWLEKNNPQARNYQTLREDASFFPEQDANYQGYYSFSSFTDPSLKVVHDESGLKLAKVDDSIADRSRFYLKELDAEDVVILYSGRHFRGTTLTLTEDDADFRTRGFDDTLESFEVKGDSAWRLYQHKGFTGKSALAPPGKYDREWVRQHLGLNAVSSASKVLVDNSIVLWSDKNFQGDYVTLTDSTKDLTMKTLSKGIGSITVAGPSSWEIFSLKAFKGSKTVVAPGRYDKDWIQQHLDQGKVQSVRKVDANQPMCGAASGSHQMAGLSGKKHDVFVVHRPDGSIWLRFGVDGKQNEWTSEKDSSSTFKSTIISDKDIAALRDFTVIGWEVSTDVDFLLSADNSWHPSKINVMYLGSRTTREMSFSKDVNDHTDLSFSAEKSTIACMGNVKDGQTKPNVCGFNNLPQQGATSAPLIITQVDMEPAGIGSYADNRELSRNKFSWKGSYYYVFAKMADCARSSGCYERSQNKNFMFGKIKEAGKDDRPDTFYFGNFANDVDRCEAACKNEADCVAYTLFTEDFADAKLGGGCYGTNQRPTEEIEEQGTFSGKSVKCDSFIPTYMDSDVWTRNTTGCPCSFDTSRTDCACCHEGACQCGHRYKYQCSLCGFSKMCGEPSVSSSNEYVFEYTNQELNQKGSHYTIPDVCITGCELSVRGTGSSANEMAAYMTDLGDNRALSCVADVAGRNDPLVISKGESLDPEGVKVNHINLYAFGGVGVMLQLKLKVKKDGCKTDNVDKRYLGCFIHKHSDFANLETAGMTSSHMTKAVCIKHCFKMGYNYGGLELGTECVCMNETPVRGEAFNCDRLCSGDSSQICGGNNAMSIYMTKLRPHMLFALARPGQCETNDAIFLTNATIKTTGDECHKISGSGSGSAYIACDLDLCGASKVVSGGLFPARPNSCGTDKVASVLFRTTGTGCLSMGGTTDAHQLQWGDCELDLCTSDKPRPDLYAPTPTRACPDHARVANTELQLTARSCQKVGGALYDEEIPAVDVTSCYFDMCVMDKDPMEENVYTFPHTDLVVEAGGQVEYDVDEMCVTECRLSVEATTEGLSIAEVQLKDVSGQDIGLFCRGDAVNYGNASDLSFSDPATGVKVGKIQITARNDSFVLKALKLRTDPNGCKADQDMIVLYDEPNFGGRPTIVKEDLADLATLDFDNKASSFKIYGNALWEMFQNKNFRGQSVVLSAGDYYNTAMLPFGNKQLSSVHRTGTLNKNMDSIRRQISNSRDIVCFKRKPKSNTVFGMITNGPRSENRPRLFYFGEFSDDLDRCERACRSEPQCASYTLFSTLSSMTEYRGQCYGRSFRDDVMTYQEDVTSGVVASCTEEDTITLFMEREFQGQSATIIEGLANVTYSTGPFSAVVTGTDSWRVKTISNSLIHTYTLSPGEYGDLNTMLVGQLFQVAKLHPNTQLYQSQHLTIDLAPVALNQIEYLVEGAGSSAGSPMETVLQEECTTTQQAEIFFVLDASSSVRDYNYVKMLDFVVDLTNSFAIGAEQVRVGVIVYSYYPHLDMPLGEHNDHEALAAAIRNLKYYKGGTYTHEALEVLMEKGFNNARPGVVKQCILITDGRSRRPSQTSDEAHKCRDHGVTMTTIGIKGADADELRAIAGDASRVFQVDTFEQLELISKDLEKVTCKAVQQSTVNKNSTNFVAITVQGNDTSYFLHEDLEFKRKPVPLGMESGIIYNTQIFASSSWHEYVAELGRLNHESGWLTHNGNHTNGTEWIEVDLGRILPVHGVSTQGHAVVEAWTIRYKVAVSLDGIHFTVLRDTNTSQDLVFVGNTDQNTVQYHCFHRLFGQALRIRVIRFIAVTWHVHIAMRIELYGFRVADDPQLLEALRKDVWTRNVTGCPCYYDPSRRDCACCEDGGCQCPNGNRHQCVQCGYPHNCGTPSLRNPVNNIDGWTSSMSGCRCLFDPLRTDCACCQNYGCQCGAGNKNQCVNCGHLEHCGLKEHLFGPNPYCRPKTCPRTINTVWEGSIAPAGVNQGNVNPSPTTEGPRESSTTPSSQ